MQSGHHELSQLELRCSRLNRMVPDELRRIGLPCNPHERILRLRGGTKDGTATTEPPQSSSFRPVVQLIVYKGAWASRLVGSAENSEVFFIRQSSMRDKSQWSKLHEGAKVSLTMRYAAGRGIVSDAVLETA